MTALPDLINGPFEACLFDMDGVLTDTASVHAQAWKQSFDEFLKTSGTGGTFDIATDYPRYVDGKPRDKGVKDFLESRNVHLPHGEPTDAPGFDTVWAVGNRKNELLVSVIQKQGVTVYEGSRRLVQQLRSAGKKTAVVSSSANTKSVLEVSNMLGLFDVRVDGVTIIDQNIPGKPAPDTFIEAARLLGVSPDKAVVFEDALAGVEAGRAGHFGLVVGVDRIGHAEDLLSHGANVVVKDLSEFSNEQAQ